MESWEKKLRGECEARGWRVDSSWLQFPQAVGGEARRLLMGVLVEVDGKLYHWGMEREVDRFVMEAGGEWWLEMAGEMADSLIEGLEGYQVTRGK